MKLLFLGAGGVGGYFGGRLAEAGADVTFLVRPPRAETLQREGLKISSPHGDVQIAVKTVTKDTLEGEFDLIALAPKAYDLNDAIDSITPAVGPNSRVLPLLNGLSHIDTLDARFGRERVVGGVAHIAAQLAEDGSIKQLTRLHSLTAGGRDPATHGVASEFIALCRQAKFDSVLSQDIVGTLWEKWTFLASLAAITTLMQGSIGQIIETSSGERLVRALYAECLAIAAACGTPIPTAARETAVDTLTKRGSPFTASMLRDLQSGLRTEHDHVLGDMLRRGRANQIEAPILEAAYCHMQVVSR